MSQERARPDANNCFVCGPDNPIGLHLTFRMDGTVCRSEFTPDQRHVGFGQGCAAAAVLHHAGNFAGGGQDRFGPREQSGDKGQQDDAGETQSRPGSVDTGWGHGYFGGL